MHQRAGRTSGLWRIVGRMFVCLLLGAIITIGVAWLCAAYAEPGTPVPTGYPGQKGMYRAETVGIRVVTCVMRDDFTMDRTQPMELSIIDVCQSGWPMLCMQGSTSIDSVGPISITTFASGMNDYDPELLVRRGGIVTHRSHAIALDSRSLIFNHQRMLPLQPMLWPGFVVNMMLYAVFAWYGVAGVRALLRRLRERARMRNLQP